MTWFERIVAAHTDVTDQVSHWERLKSDRYFVWQEDGRNDLIADGIHVEGAVTGTTDLYTRQEFDPWAEAFQTAMDAHGISWYLNSVQYEEDTGVTHYEWVWEVLSDGNNSV